MDLSRFRWGPDSDVTAGGDWTLSILFLHNSEYSRAIPPCREALEFQIKHNPGSPRRFWLELRLGVSLLAQKDFSEAEPRLIAGYNGLKPHAHKTIPAGTPELGWVIEQVVQLCDDSGRPLQDVCLVKLRGDPTLQTIAFDLQFPANPFAGP